MSASSARRKLQVAGLLVPRSPRPAFHAEQVPLVENLVKRARAVIRVHAAFDQELSDDSLAASLMQGQSAHCADLVQLAIVAARLLEKSDG